MYPLTPMKVYIDKRVDQKAHWRARADRIIAGCARPPQAIIPYGPDNLPEVVADLAASWPPQDVPEGLEPTYMRSLIFTIQELGEELPDISAAIERCGGEKHAALVRRFLGHIPTICAHHDRDRDAEEDMVCWPTFDFCTMTGCPHGCLYCGEGRNGSNIALGVNLEEYVDEVVSRTVAKHPFQTCFRLLGSVTEQLVPEPEYGAFDLISRKLAETDRYLYFHSAGGNVDWIAELPQRDRIIGVFSVTCEAVMRGIEAGAGTVEERFAAAGRLNDFGIQVRPKFKPIIPVRNWREENAKAIEAMFRLCRPESVGLCVLMWMDIDHVKEILPVELLDPEFLAVAEAAKEELAGVRTGPFPPAVREAIYRFFIAEIRKHDSDVPIYISTETREMWDTLEEVIGQKGCSFFCGCSPVAPPGRRLKLTEDCRYSTYGPPRRAEAPAAL